MFFFLLVSINLNSDWKDSSDCKNILNFGVNDFCYYYFYEQNNDSSLCYKLSNTGIYKTDNCLGKVTGNISYCDQLIDYKWDKENVDNDTRDFLKYNDRDSCVKDIAIKTHNSSLCELTHKDFKSYCYDLYGIYTQ